MKKLRTITVLVLAALSTISQAAAGVSPASAGMPDTLTLSLDETVSLALDRNLDLMIAREKVLESEERVREAKTSFMPKLTGEANYTRLDMAPFFPAAMFGGFGSSPGDEMMPKKIVIGSPNNYSVSLNLTQPIFTFGKILDQCDISEFARDAALSDLGAKRNLKAFESIQAYWNLYYAIELKKVAVKSSMLLSSQLQDVQNLYNSGLAAKNDMLKTRALLAESHLGLIQANNSIELARKQLCGILNLPLDTPLELAENPSTSAEPFIINIDDITDLAVDARPEIAAVENQLGIAKKQYAIDSKSYLPDISFFANLGYYRPDRQYLDQFYTTWTMGVMARVNIFDWGGAAHRARQSKSRSKQLELELEKVIEAVRLDVTTAYLQLSEAAQSVSASEEALSHANENYRVANQKFIEGLTNNTELLDAQLILYRARVNNRNALARYLVARSNLERAAGNLLDKESEFKGSNDSEGE